MSDDYQAIYDSIRSRFHMPDVEGIMRQCFDFSYPANQMHNAINEISATMQSPSAVYRPQLVKDRENAWAAIYGDVVGKGKTPFEAMQDFDYMWQTGEHLPPKKTT